MEGFVDQCVDLVKTHQAWAGVVVGLLAFGESLILIGILLPGTTVLVIIGGLVGAGLIHPLPVMLAAILGAALGDVVSYYLGVWLGGGIVHNGPSIATATKSPEPGCSSAATASPRYSLAVSLARCAPRCPLSRARWA